MSDFKANLILFAAGVGARLRPATNDNPKPVIPLFGIPMGYYSLPYFKNIVVDKFVVNTFHLPEKVRQCYSKLNTEIQFSNEVDFIRGSGGGLKQAEKFFNPNLPIIAGNADEVFFTAEHNFLHNALEQHQKEKALATLVVTENSDVGKKFGGIWVEHNHAHRVVHIGKDRPSENVKGWHFTGLQILSPEIFKYADASKEQNIFYDVLIHHLNDKKVQIYPVKMDWYELGNLADYTEAKRKIAVEKYRNDIYKKHFTQLGQLPKSNLSDLS